MAQKRHRLYYTWCNLKKRCNNPNGKDADRYHNRGITYSPKWEKFSGFIEDMGDSYSEGLQLDRIDNDGNYCKENCRWVTKVEQMNNMSTNRHISIDGVTKTFAEWTKTSSVKPSTIRQRFYVYGWPIEKSLYHLEKEG